MKTNKQYSKILIRNTALALSVSTFLVASVAFAVEAGINTGIETSVDAGGSVRVNAEVNLAARITKGKEKAIRTLTDEDYMDKPTEDVSRLVEDNISPEMKKIDQVLK